MKTPKATNSSAVGNTISQRAGFGSNALVEGWQSMLAQILTQLKPYLRPSRIITFASLTPEEKMTFETIVSLVHPPYCVCGVFISPSVRNQMMYTNRGQAVPDEALSTPDDGAILFCKADSDDTIVNALLAHPPYAAAVDVYSQGGLLAGYVYNGIEDCLTSLSEVIQTHLGRCD